MIKVSDYVANFIQRQGVSDVFLLPGGGCIHLIDSIGKSQLNFVCNLHEQACSIAADAYGQYTNNIGVCLVTTGPGGTNAVTGVAAAWLDSTPMLALSGQVQKKENSIRRVANRGWSSLEALTSVPCAVVSRL